MENLLVVWETLSVGTLLWRYAHPLAEIHWRQSATKYGFRGTESMKKYWKSSCTKDINISLILGNRAISLTTSNGEQKLVPYSDAPKLLLYLRAGYQLTGTRFVCRRGSVGVIRLVNKDVKTPHGGPNRFVLMCVDVEQCTTLGTFLVKGHGGRVLFHHAEVHSMAYSADRTLIALSIGMVHECHYLHEAYENSVIIYNCQTRTEVYRSNIGEVIAAVAFDPNPSCSQFSIAGIPTRASRALATFDLTSGSLVASTCIQDLLDVDGEIETHLELTYSQDGGLLVVQALEPLGYSREWLYNTFVYTTDTLTPVARFTSSLLQACHDQCTPIAAPIVSPCDTYMALANYSVNLNTEAAIKVYRLPVSLSLKRQCRAVIIRTLSDPAAASLLPIPRSLKSYISWSQPCQEAPYWHCPDTESGYADTKDASWYTEIDDVTCNPELSEIPLHPRARNETYS